MCSLWFISRYSYSCKGGTNWPWWEHQHTICLQSMYHSSRQVSRFVFGGGLKAHCNWTLSCCGFFSYWAWIFQVWQNTETVLGNRCCFKKQVLRCHQTCLSTHHGHPERNVSWGEGADESHSWWNTRELAESSCHFGWSVAHSWPFQQEWFIHHKELPYWRPVVVWAQVHEREWWHCWGRIIWRDIEVNGRHSFWRMLWPSQGWRLQSGGGVAGRWL